MQRREVAEFDEMRLLLMPMKGSILGLPAKLERRVCKLPLGKAL